jgi:hypothetical protein
MLQPEAALLPPPAPMQTGASTWKWMVALAYADHVSNEAIRATLIQKNLRLG